MTTYNYNLSLINNINFKELYTLDNSNEKQEILKKFNLKHKVFSYNKNKYGLITYDKKKLNNYNVFTTGLFRSIIHSENKIHTFSPPKSVDLDLFRNNTNIANINIEEYVEGTMINMFWDDNNNEWELSTKKVVGADNVFFVNNLSSKKNSFKKMFNDFVNKQENFYSKFNLLPKNYSYSFVLQHPKNRIVVPLKQIKLYLVSIYEIIDYYVSRVIITNELYKKLPDFLSFPILYKCNNWSDISNLCNNSLSSYIVGFMLTDKIRNIRTKIRNPNYEYVKNLRGNQPNLKFTYLTIRSNYENLKNYLQYYPEHQHYFNMYQDEITNFTKALHTYYVECYVKKLKPLKEYDYEYRKFMLILHNIYKNFLRKNKKIVTINFVYKYVNNIPPPLLMYSLNYKYKLNKYKSPDIKNNSVNIGSENIV